MGLALNTDKGKLKSLAAKVKRNWSRAKLIEKRPNRSPSKPTIAVFPLNVQRTGHTREKKNDLQKRERKKKGKKESVL